MGSLLASLTLVAVLVQQRQVEVVPAQQVLQATLPRGDAGADVEGDLKAVYRQSQQLKPRKRKQPSQPAGEMNLHAEAFSSVAVLPVLPEGSRASVSSERVGEVAEEHLRPNCWMRRLGGSAPTAALGQTPEQPPPLSFSLCQTTGW